MRAPDRKTGRPSLWNSFPAVRVATVLLILGGAAALLSGLFRLMAPGGPDEAQATPTAAPTVSPVPTPEPPDVDVTDWELQLIDGEHPLAASFAPPALADVGDGQQMDSRVAPQVQQLMEDVREVGYTVYVRAGYRDYQTQAELYRQQIDQYMAEGMTAEEADEKARLAVGFPGCSEHQSGLSVDLLQSPEQSMVPEIGGSGLMLWLEQHCASYGFVIRYPDGKTDVTGSAYEPWHLRYVGRGAARYMMDNDLCLEEFLALYGR